MKPLSKKQLIDRLRQLHRVIKEDAIYFAAEADHERSSKNKLVYQGKSFTCYLINHLIESLFRPLV